MAEQDKPFICYKAGLKMSIQPRNKAGWIYTALSMLSMVPLLGGFAWLMASKPTGARLIAYATGFGLVMLVQTITIVVWMKNRSEVIDVNELLKLKRELDEQKKRGRR